MKGERDEVARRKVLEGLGRGLSVAAAARAAGVARQTVYQWRDRGDEEMGRALASRGSPASDPPTPPAAAPPARQRAHKDERLALRALREIAEGGDSEMCRVVAAKALLDHRRKLREAATPKPGAAAPPGGPAPRPGRSPAELLRLLSGGA